MKTPYSTQYTPPAPVLFVQLAVPDQAPRMKAIPALIGLDGPKLTIELRPQ